MKTKFADVAAASSAIVELIAELALDSVVVAILPGAADAAVAVAAALGTDLVWVNVTPDAAGELVISEGDLPANLSDRSVVVVALAVETGQEAAAVGRVLQERGAQGMVLLTAICPREAEPQLRAIYADIRAVVRPLARRAAAWHFENHDVPSLTGALEIIGSADPH